MAGASIPLTPFRAARNDEVDREVGERASQGLELGRGSKPAQALVELGPGAPQEQARRISEDVQKAVEALA